MKIMVVSPHPDDETLGAGGTLIKMKKQGHDIYWLNITDVSEGSGWDSSFVEKRREQIEKVNNYYDFREFFNLSFPSTKLTLIDEGSLIGAIKDVFDKVEPQWIIIPGNYDAHSDHRVVYNSCMAAAKSFRAPYIKKITTMEITSETDFGFQKEKFEPNMFVDITEEIDQKIKAMEYYDTELQEDSFPRSIRNIKAKAMVHGASCCCEYAEAFHIVRFVE